MKKISIEINNLSKIYRIGEEFKKPDTLAGSLISWIKSPISNYKMINSLVHFNEDDVNTIMALNDISFNVYEGEIFGVIGKNGAGKSTLLKILSRITSPSGGVIKIHGRVASLLEVGTGFHPELTGRENIFLNGTILGMSKNEIENSFDEIVDFSGIKKFIDTPVKRYSSGMRVRLAFAVASNLKPEILLIDEVLAVGDIDFQKKCLGKMEQIAGDGRTVLFVSHNMAAVASLCTKACLIENGKLEFIGNTPDCIKKYMKSVEVNSSSKLVDRNDRSGNQKLSYIDANLIDRNQNVINTIACGDELILKAKLKINSLEVYKVYFQVNIVDNLGRVLLLCSTAILNKNYDMINSDGTMTCKIPNLQLAPGQYSVFLSVKEMRTVKMDWIENALQFTVVEGDFFGTGRNIPPNSAPFLTKFDIDFKPKK